MLISRSHFLLLMVPVTLTASLLAGCAAGGGPTPTATIKYHQVGACNGYTQGNNAVSVGPNAAYVVFRIEGVDDSQPSIDFHFDPSRLFVTTTNRPHVDTGLMFAQDLGVLGTVPVTVTHGTNLPINGFSIAVVSTATANGSVEANKTSYFLGYENQSADPGILLEKTNSSQTTWPQTDDCRAMTLQ